MLSADPHIEFRAPSLAPYLLACHHVPHNDDMDESLNVYVSPSEMFCVRDQDRAKKKVNQVVN